MICSIFIIKHLKLVVYTGKLPGVGMFQYINNWISLYFNSSNRAISLIKNSLRIKTPQSKQSDVFISPPSTGRHITLAY
jgi:hypothetical protein